MEYQNNIRILMSITIRNNSKYYDKIISQNIYTKVLLILKYIKVNIIMQIL